ncbi:MAG TPA: FxLYD domain-containing protein [Chthonomonadaceae bacterium]|nr:FxLYD domain-containing protein [Chthonomonadaceae bacterium]
MGYPLRWESIAAPVLEQCAPEHRAEDDEERERARAAARYFRCVALATLAGCAVLVLSVIGFSRLRLDAGSAPALALDSAPNSGAIQSTPYVVRHAGYVVVSGMMVNRTARPQERLEAVVELLDSNRRALATQSAMVDRDAIAPGEGTSFQLAMADVPAARAYRIHFKRLFGPDVN